MSDIDFRLEQTYYLKIDAAVSEHIMNLAQALESVEVGTERWNRGYEGMKSCNDMLSYLSMIISKYEYLLRLLRASDSRIVELEREVEALKQQKEDILKFSSDK
jgi:hypothetical protein